MNVFTLEPMSVWQIATLIALLAAVIGLWISPRYWWIGVVAATLLGNISGVVQGIAVAWIVLASLLCWAHARASSQAAPAVFRALTALGVIVMSLLFGLHALPGFNNPMVIENVRLTADAEPYTLYLNFDKTLAGLLLLGVCHPNWRGLQGLRSTMHSHTWILIAANVVVVIAASYLLGYVRFEAKWTSISWPLFCLWAAANLFSTCLSEEAFFRGFIQRELQIELKHVRHGQAFALLVSSATFGLAHYAGGWRYVFLSMLAGFGYGWVYRRTHRIEWSMLAHFAVNATHFLLFTYPRLA